MKAAIYSLGVLAGAALLTTAPLSRAQSTENNDVSRIRSGAAASARDGFTRSGTDTLFTRDGITSKVENPVKLQNGLKVEPNGQVTFSDGKTAWLSANQILTLNGVIENTSLTPAGTATINSTPSAAATTPMPVKTAGDGIFMSGKRVFITKGGVTSQVSSDLKLEGGVTIQPDGDILTGDGKRVTLQTGQVLTLDGKIVTATGR